MPLLKPPEPQIAMRKFYVRIEEPLALTMERYAEFLGTDNRETVLAEIELSEEAHTAITRRHFGVNWRDPEHYDVVLSTERLSV